MLPQNPPKDFFTPLGQKRRHPTARTARPIPYDHGQIGGSNTITEAIPVMKVTRKPYRRTIHPEMVNGQMKYAAKYEACRPLDLLAVILRVVWKWEFKVSSKP